MVLIITYHLDGMPEPVARAHACSAIATQALMRHHVMQHQDGIVFM
jgi:hypothetical protein